MASFSRFSEGENSSSTQSCHSCGGPGSLFHCARDIAENTAANNYEEFMFNLLQPVILHNLEALHECYFTDYLLLIPLVNKNVKRNPVHLIMKNNHQIRPNKEGKHKTSLNMHSNMINNNNSLNIVFNSISPVPLGYLYRVLNN